MSTPPNSHPAWLDHSIRKLTRIVKLWPLGTLVWHRAGGERMVVEGYKVAGSGGVLICISRGGTTDEVYEFELSRAPVPEEDWQQLSQEHDDPDADSPLA